MSLYVDSKYMRAGDWIVGVSLGCVIGAAFCKLLGFL